MTLNCHLHPTLQVYGESINHVTNFRYLGSKMASAACDFKRRETLAWCAFWQLERLWGSLQLPISTKVNLFYATCVTILLYGCESWVISHDMENKINAFATSWYRIMLIIKQKDHVPSTTIYSMTNIEPLINHVRNHNSWAHPPSPRRKACQ